MTAEKTNISAEKLNEIIEKLKICSDEHNNKWWENHERTHMVDYTDAFLEGFSEGYEQCIYDLENHLKGN